MISSVAGPRRSSKALRKAKLAPKTKQNKYWSYFLNSGNTITSKKYAQEIWDAPETAIPTASSGQQKGHNSLKQHPNAKHSQCFKSWMNWAKRFCLIHHIHITFCQPTTTSSSILTTFCREILSQLTGWRKCFPMVLPILKDGFLCYRNEQTLSHWQKCVACNSYYFD